MGGGMLSRLPLGLLLLSLLLQQMRSQPVSTPGEGASPSQDTSNGGGSAVQPAVGVVLLSLSLLFRLYC